MIIFDLHQKGKEISYIVQLSLIWPSFKLLIYWIRCYDRLLIWPYALLKLFGSSHELLELAVTFFTGIRRSSVDKIAIA